MASSASHSVDSVINHITLYMNGIHWTMVAMGDACYYGIYNEKVLRCMDFFVFVEEVL